jgi:hypothetical protein
VKEKKGFNALISERNKKKGFHALFIGKNISLIPCNFLQTQLAFTGSQVFHELIFTGNEPFSTGGDTSRHDDSLPAHQGLGPGPL